MAHGKGENTKAGEAVRVEESARKNILKKTRHSEAGEHGRAGAVQATSTRLLLYSISGPSFSGKEEPAGVDFKLKK